MATVLARDYTRAVAKPGRQCKHNTYVSIAIWAVLWQIRVPTQVRACLESSVLTGVRARLGCVALAVRVSFSGFHSGHCLICCTDQTVMLKSSLLWAAWFLLDCLLLATVVEVSVSCL